MPPDNIRCYTSEHWISRRIMHDFAQGCDGQMVPPIKLLDGPAAMYGILRGTENIIRECENVGREYYYCDHGYIRPSAHTQNDFTGYYRISRNARQTAPKGNFPGDRWKKLDTELRPWKRTGKSILVIPLTGAVAKFYNVDPDRWLRAVVEEISHHTHRPIFIKEKGEGNIKESLKDTWCLVTHSSNTAVDALLEGVPIITLGESAAEPMSWKFGHIENPCWPDREPWLHGLAYQQFLLSEMKSGEMWKIMEKYNDE